MFTEDRLQTRYYSRHLKYGSKQNKDSYPPGARVLEGETDKKQ